jgi:DNA helicase II / ATP-dependent DNA helicase PcrA
MTRTAIRTGPIVECLPSPTPEQEHILFLVRTTSSNLLINALAGSGKTTTLEMIQDALLPPVLCLAFNRRIADVMVKRFKSTTTVRTFNGLGHRIWATTCAGHLSLDPRKVPDLLREVIKGLPRGEANEAWTIFWEVKAAIDLAKSMGYVPDGKFHNAKRLIERSDFYKLLPEDIGSIGPFLLDETLLRSIKAAYSGLIDYNDQVYMPALFGGTYPRFPTILVDEAQDLSPVNHEMLSHLSKSRIIAVGDPWQSIYGFRGAVREGMQKLKERFSMTTADLSISFRCPEAVVRAVRWRVPHMKWSKPGGRVAQLRNPMVNSFSDGCCVICRNNAPLFALALRLLAAGRSVSVSGSDVGPRVVGIMRKLGDDNLPREGLLVAISEWETEKISKGSTSAQDIAECMRVFAGCGRTLSQAVAYAEHLFKQSGGITLLTGHKSKGLEWHTVYHLDPFLLRADEQDLNLRYVIATRSLDTYYEINSQDIRWPDDSQHQS